MEPKNESSKHLVSQRDTEVQRKLEALRGEYGKLHELKIATDRDKKNLEEQLKVLKEKAEREYGTSDIEQLKALLEQRRRDNERMVEEYAQHITGIKQRLEEIDAAEQGGGA